MENKVMCSICGKKEAKIVMLPHWKTGMIIPFLEGTCGHADCVKEYDEVLAQVDAQMEDQYGWEDMFNEQQ